MSEGKAKGRDTYDGPGFQPPLRRRRGVPWTKSSAIPTYVRAGCCYVFARVRVDFGSSKTSLGFAALPHSPLGTVRENFLGIGFGGCSYGYNHDYGYERVPAQLLP